MKSIPQYNFYKTKYGEELLIDVVTLDDIRPYIDKHPIHTLSYFDITFITKGSGELSVANYSYTLNSGDVIFSIPGEIREWKVVPQGYALIFEEEFLLSFFNDPSFIRNLSYFNINRVSSKINLTDNYTRMEDLILNIREEINNEQSKDKHVLRALLYEIVTRLHRDYSKAHAIIKEKPLNRHIDHFIQLVGKEFKSHHDTTYYADKLCLTPNYLNEIVQPYLGMSPKCYIQNRIIQEAKILLSYTNLSISEITETLHFESSSYFIRIFRQQTNSTPLQYRQSTIR